MTSRLLLLFSVMSLPLLSIGQTIHEMAMFTRFQNTGTARSIGVGGAFSALGNDFGAIAINPAGTGVFRHELNEFSLGVNSFSSSTIFDGEQADFSDVNLTLGNFGLSRILKEERGKTEVFAFSFTQLASFAGQFTAETFRDVSGGRQYFEYLDEETSGYLSEINLSYGVNLRNKWYYGFGVGIPYSRLTLTSDNGGVLLANDGVTELGDFRDVETVFINSIGINAKAGVIFRPIPQLRLGLSVQTPGVHAFSGDFDFSQNSRGDINHLEEASGSNPFYNFNMRSSGRLNTGMAFVWGKFGFFSIDYDIMDPRMGNYGGSQIPGSEIKEDIRENLAVIHQVRTGIEVRLNNFYLRGGYSFSTSGYNSDIYGTHTVNGTHGGLGYQGDKFGINLGMVSYTSSQSRFFRGNLAPERPFTTDLNQTIFMATLVLVR
ncbi:MAG: hypothetical protein JJU02_03130 [Cryomorphaceae bacterium]|nr:hypothetical protein [Cryomorphaceae bacterium]